MKFYLRENKRKMEKLIVEPKDKDKRLDIFLQEKFNSLSRSFISNSNKTGKIKVNDKIVKNGYKLNTGDRVEIEIVQSKSLSAKAENIPLDVVYEDEDLIVINKPQGLCTHPAKGNEEHTLVNALSYRYETLSDVNGEFRLGIVHRLDKDTSGLMLVAKNNRAHLSLAKQIETKTCKRKYLALVVGTFKERDGMIDKNLSRSKKNRLKYEVCSSSEGKVAITFYKTLEVYKGYSLVEFELKTGRTHQIRVHSSFMGHPIVGDKLYGQKNPFNLNGQLLTSFSIEFFQPTTNKKLSFQIGLPDYFENIVENLRKGN